MSTTYNGTHYLTIRLAARAWALAAAPDASVFGAGDSPASEAHALRVFWDREAVQSEGAVDLPTEDGETVDEDRWIEKREVELETLIGDYIATARDARDESHPTR
jgi:hypothetical protein